MVDLVQQAINDKAIITDEIMYLIPQLREWADEFDGECISLKVENAGSYVPLTSYLEAMEVGYCFAIDALANAELQIAGGDLFSLLTGDLTTSQAMETIISYPYVFIPFKSYSQIADKLIPSTFLTTWVPEPHGNVMETTPTMCDASSGRLTLTPEERERVTGLIKAYNYKTCKHRCEGIINALDDSDERASQLRNAYNYSGSSSNYRFDG